MWSLHQSSLWARHPSARTSARGGRNLKLTASCEEPAPDALSRPIVAEGRRLGMGAAAAVNAVRDEFPAPRTDRAAGGIADRSPMSDSRADPPSGRPSTVRRPRSPAKRGLAEDPLDDLIE
jgi:hypothetical protein